MAVLNYHMGMLLYKTGKPTEAIEKLNKALEDNEDFHGRSVAEETLAKLKSGS